MGPLSSCSDCSVLKFFYSCLSWFCIISWNTYCFKRLKKCWNKKIGHSLQMGKNETGIRKITFLYGQGTVLCMTLYYGHMCSTSPLYTIKLYIMHMFTITKQLEHLHVLKEQTLSEEKGLGWGRLHVYLIQCSKCEWRIIFLKKMKIKVRYQLQMI